MVRVTLPSYTSRSASEKDNSETEHLEYTEATGYDVDLHGFLHVCAPAQKIAVFAPGQWAIAEVFPK